MTMDEPNPVESSREEVERWWNECLPPNKRNGKAVIIFSRLHNQDLPTEPVKLEGESFEHLSMTYGDG